MIILFLRRQPTLWKGRSLLGLNVVVFAVIAAIQIANGLSANSGLIAFEAFLVLSGALAMDFWVVLRSRRAEIEEVLEKCFAKTLARYERVLNGYSVTAGSEMKVILSKLGPVTRIRFRGARGSRKAGLIKSVFSKQFKTSFPKPRFKT